MCFFISIFCSTPTELLSELRSYPCCIHELRSVSLSYPRTSFASLLYPRTSFEVMQVELLRSSKCMHQDFRCFARIRANLMQLICGFVLQELRRSSSLITLNKQSVVQGITTTSLTELSRSSIIYPKPLNIIFYLSFFP